MVGQEGERSSLVKVAGLGIVVVLLIAGAVYMFGGLFDDDITSPPPDSPDQIVPNKDLAPWLIEETDFFGNKKYVIDRNLLPLEGSELRLVEGNDDKYDDGVMNPNNGIAEMMFGVDKILTIDLEGNENMREVGVLIVDNDFFNKYDGVLAQGPAWYGELLLDKENVFTEIADDVFAALVPISDESRYSAGDNSIFSPVIAYEKI